MERVFKVVIRKLVTDYLNDTPTSHVCLTSIEPTCARCPKSCKIVNSMPSCPNVCLVAHRFAFLGHTLSADGFSVDLSKESAVLNRLVPQDIPRMPSLLGLAQHFRKFVNGYAPMPIPLSSLLRKNVPWLRSHYCQTALDNLKAAMISAPVLALPKGGLPFELICDASGFGLRANS